MKIIVKILKGILIGLGSILPGVSGGMIAASFNVYEDLVNALDKFIKEPIKSVLKIWEYLIGIAIGIGIGFILIATVLKMFPIPITMLFIGLIIGGIPSFIKEIKNEDKKPHHFIVMIISGLLILSVLLLKPTEVNSVSTPVLYLIYIIIGLFVALSLIIPGLSGTMILMAMGIYTFFTSTIADFIVEVLKLNIGNAIVYLPAIMVIGISGFITLIVSSKLISKILTKHRLSFNMAILGILFVSPFNILWTLRLENKGVFNELKALDYILSFIALIIGFILAYKLIANEKEGNESNET